MNKPIKKISEYLKSITILVISENLNPIYRIVKEKFSLKNPKLYKECMTLLTFLPTVKYIASAVEEYFDFLIRVRT